LLNYKVSNIRGESPGKTRRLNWTGHENRKWKREGERGWSCRRLL